MGFDVEGFRAALARGERPAIHTFRVADYPDDDELEFLASAGGGVSLAELFSEERRADEDQEQP